MSSSTSESALLRDGTTIAAEISELRLVPKTREQYNSSIRNFKVWIKEKHDVFFEETSRELILPLPKEVILQYMGEISIHKKLKNADGSEKSVSSSLICSFRSSLVVYYRQRNMLCCWKLVKMTISGRSGSGRTWAWKVWAYSGVRLPTPVR